MSFEKRLISMATVAAHSNFSDKGFRQKDVKFFAELLTNWTDVFTKPDKPIWHNTQCMRYLNDLIKKGYAKHVTKKTYTLTRLGLLELMNELIGMGGYYNLKNTLSIHFFITTYGDRIVELIEREGSGFSQAVQIELQQLLDHKHFLQQQEEALNKEIRRLEVRMEESKKAADLAEKLQRQGQDLKHIIEDVARLYPYELENQKPMEELFREISPELRLWEIIDGNRYRQKLLWEPELEALLHHKQTLKSLR